mgnify:CR=1 FL=1
MSDGGEQPAAAPLPVESSQITRLRPEELLLASQVRVDPETLIALTLQVQPDARPGRGMIELVSLPGQGHAFVLPFIALLPESLCKYSRISDAQGAPLRGPTEGMLPAITGRLVLPKKNLTPAGWAAVERSELLDQLNQLAGWALDNWSVEQGAADLDYAPEVQVQRWTRESGVRGSVPACIVTADAARAMAIVLSPAGAFVAARTFVVGVSDERKTARAWATDVATAYLTRAQANAEEKAAALLKPPTAT